MVIDRNITGNVTNSPFHDKKLQVALSTQIIIEAQHLDGQYRAIGAIQSLAPTESRQLQRIGEVGTDATIQIVPNAIPTIELAVTRIVFDYQRLPAAFGRGFRHIHAQRVPFDIQVIDYNAYRETTLDPGGGENVASAAPRVDVITTRYVNCWITNYSTTWTQDNYIISETATIWAETVYDVNSGGTIAVGGDDAVEKANNDTYAANTLSHAYATPPDTGTLPGA